MSEIDEATDTLVEELWRRHATELVRYATVLVGPSDAHDLVVEAFLGATDRLLSGAVRHPRAYLYRALTNRAHALHRARERRWRRDLAAVGPTTADAPDDNLDVRRAVAELSVQQRAVAYLAYWEDLTEASIASVLGIAPGTVRRHLTRARATLGKALR